MLQNIFPPVAQNVLILHKETISMMTTISLRIDSQIMDQFVSLCEKFGTSVPMAINKFVKNVVKEQKWPFELNKEDMDATEIAYKEEISNKALEAFESLQKYVAESGLSQLTLEDIDAEIKAVRDERRESKK